MNIQNPSERIGNAAAENWEWSLDVPKAANSPGNLHAGAEPKSPSVIVLRLSDLLREGAAAERR